MITDTITSNAESAPSLAAVNAVRHALKKHKKESYHIHIIVMHLLETDQLWQATVDIVTEAATDDDLTSFTSYIHLQEKYNELYEVLVNEVDHLNMIDDDASWEEIEPQLLDIFFHDAATDQDIEESGDSGDGDQGDSFMNFVQKPKIDELMN